MLINEIQDFHRVIRWLKDQDRVAMDTETTGLSPYHGARICGIAFYNRGDHFYLPFRHASGVNLPMACMSELVTTLQNMSAPMITWNGKFDLHMLHAEGYPLPYRGRIRDVMLAAHLINENEDTFALKRLSDIYLGDTSSRDEQELKGLIEQRFKGDIAAIRRTASNKEADSAWKGLMWKLFPEEVADYAESDVRLTMLMEDFYWPQLQAWRLDGLYGEVCDYLQLITRMEARGVLLDVDLIEQHMEQAGPLMDAAREDLAVMYAGLPDINPNSPAQLKAAFPQWQNTKKDYLEVVSEGEGDEAEAAKLVMAYRDYSKQKTSYYEKWLKSMDVHHVLRPSFQLTGTYTGRLSCWNPNLQAVPRTRSTNRVKDTVMAREGYDFAEGDYSQAELRTFCHYAQEHTLGREILAGSDLHAITAKLINADRTTGKRFNFSVVYGVGKDTLSENLGIPVHVAADYLKRYHEQYPGFRRLNKQMDRIASEFGYIRLDSGRVRHFNKGHMTPTHKAASNLIQGTVGEFMRVAMQKIDRALEGSDVHMLLQVHDSLAFEIPEGAADRYLPEIHDLMTQFKMTYPMKVDFKLGKRWGTSKDYEPQALIGAA